LSSTVPNVVSPGDRRQFASSLKPADQVFSSGNRFFKFQQDFEPLRRIVDLVPFFGVLIVPIEELKHRLRSDCRTVWDEFWSYLL